MPEAIDLSRPHTLYLPDEAATTALGTRIAPLLKAGDVIYLQGELGMGKSSLVRAVVRALTNPDQDVPSPTFTLMQTYDGPGFEIAHLDLYRLKSPEESYELALDDAVPHSVLLIEWPQRLGHLGFVDRLDINLTEGQAGGRQVIMTPQGLFR
ncbi:tRNA (adenosine(37)-N6)-threonylcarbamoyltransferase complex ATPase subunit type 1 TsaE [Asticcacaulis taihuensis]|uniref:tRNA (adenosine(37)-N6)-threonylcarbamoyltransferase complex ATPase subunit type 1 TsaE n=1 Tax=Asticcacaulis taihuensis TaxID=260084 RepID=UPI0026F2C56A|nr:tRNA (adenosine(37)-N6)-threonylcarbamoyltransferase complex ATPase subunit type 1 TsaE [Asticcacaulis taihuensis]